jgi:tyrosyl-tRNA synthetase
MDLLADLEARGLVHDTTDRDALAARLAEGPVTLYYDSLHVGNLIGILVMRRFLEAGHRAVALAGGATGMIGDPSGRSDERNLLDETTVRHNVGRIAEQLRRIGGVEELVDNTEWTAPMTFLDFLRDVGKHVTVNQMIAKEAVRARLEGESGISYTEFSYMLIQAHDYLRLHLDRQVELQIGGSDQWGNIVLGVDLVRRATGRHVHALTWPLLLRSDGKKLGKTAEGATWLAADRTSPYQLFQYWMRVPDADVRKMLLQFTLLPVAECHEVADAHEVAPERREGQRRLAREATALVHGAEATERAEAASALLFGASPLEAEPGAFETLAAEVPTTAAPVDGVGVVDLLVLAGVASSKGDARRTLGQGGVSVNGERVDDERVLSAADRLHGRWVLLRKGKSTYHLVDAGSG